MYPHQRCCLGDTPALNGTLDQTISIQAVYAAMLDDLQLVEGLNG